MDVVRQPVRARPSAEAMREFRSRQLTARQLLKGDLDVVDPAAPLEQGILTTSLEKAGKWSAGNAFMPATFGLACCAIEMISTVAARTDIARFGFEAFRASPRQADLLILSGRVSIKMAPVARRVYDQMLEPKWAIAMGACSSSAGVFNNYAILVGDDGVGRVLLAHTGPPVMTSLPFHASGIRTTNCASWFHPLVELVFDASEKYRRSAVRGRLSGSSAPSA